jgi:hypothetical protein
MVGVGDTRSHEGRDAERFYKSRMRPAICHYRLQLPKKPPTSRRYRTSSPSISLSRLSMVS